MTGIYQIFNTVNNKRYIGSALNIEKRWRLHKFHLKIGKHHSNILQKAWNKYGDEKFKFIVLVTCPKEELIIKEQSFMNLLKPEYNICKVAYSWAGNKHSDESKLKMSLATKGKPKSEEHKAKISKLLTGNKINLGKHHSEETKEKLRQKFTGTKHSEESKALMSQKLKGHKRNIGRVTSEETKIKLSKAGKGRKLSEETIERMKLAAKGRVNTPESRIKQSIAMKGRKASEETKLKLSEAQKVRWAKIKESL